MFHTPGWLGDLGHVRQPDGQGVRPEGRRGADGGLAGADDARPRARARRPDRALRGLRRARAVLPLPVRPPEPDQLERRALRPRGDADGRPGAAARGLPAPHAPLRRRRPEAAGDGRRAQPRRRATASSTSRTSAASRKNVDSRRVREHDAALRLLRTSGAARRDAAAAPRPTWRSCARGPRGCSSATGCTTGCSAGTAGWASSAG